MEEAIRLMPDDATASYVLGEWHYTLSTTSWMEKQIAGNQPLALSSLALINGAVLLRTFLSRYLRQIARSESGGRA